MLIRLLLLFTLVPLLELVLLLRIGDLVGLLPTLALVIATGVAGAWLARQEGLRAWLAVQRELAAGRIPTEELVHGLLVLVAGAVLVTPGVLTDAAGLLLLVRPVRGALIRRLRERYRQRLEQGTLGGPSFRFVWLGSSPPDPGAGSGAGSGYEDEGDAEAPDGWYRDPRADRERVGRGPDEGAGPGSGRTIEL